MKRFIITLVMMSFAIALTFGQHRMMRPFIDYSNYEKVDSLPLEMVSVHLPFEVTDEKALENSVSLGSGYYMFKMPRTDNVVIKTNADRTKAIVVYKSFVIGGRFELPIGGRYEYNIKEDERRLVLWYKDNRTYCGYIYDKVYKVCQCFEEKKEFKRFTNYFKYQR